MKLRILGLFALFAFALTTAPPSVSASSPPAAKNATSDEVIKADTVPPNITWLIDTGQFQSISLWNAGIDDAIANRVYDYGPSFSTPTGTAAITANALKIDQSFDTGLANCDATTNRSSNVSSPITVHVVNHNLGSTAICVSPPAIKDGAGGYNAIIETDDPAMATF
jgi:hypothetical protein